MSLLILNDNRDIFIAAARAVLMHLSTFQGYLLFFPAKYTEKQAEDNRTVC